MKSALKSFRTPGINTIISTVVPAACVHHEPSAEVERTLIKVEIESPLRASGGLREGAWTPLKVNLLRQKSKLSRGRAR